jgi:plasmid replication initiation protein
VTFSTVFIVTKSTGIERRKMTPEESFEIKKSKGYLVVKSNDLIQRNRFELSLPEQKTVAYICSMIQPMQTEESGFQLEYEFKIREYCKICGIDYDNGKNYQDVKATLKKLRDKSMWLTLPDGSETTVGWLAKATTNKKSGIAHIKLDEDMVPYLFDLKQKFTQYQLYNVLGMKSAFSVRIYELMKSYSFRHTITFELDELKKLLMVEDVKSYNRFPDFRRKILEKAQLEINELTDINIEFEPIKTSRKVTSIKFIIEEKFKNSRKRIRTSNEKRRL